MWGKRTADPSLKPYIILDNIQSSGTQYIDTNYNPKWNTRVVVELSNFVVGNGQCFVFGTRKEASGTANDNYTVGVKSNQFRVDYMGSSTNFTQTVSTGKITIDMNGNVCTINNETITSAEKTSGESVYPLLLFAINNGGVPAAWANMRLYSCKIYEEDVLIRDYIPVKMRSSGNVGLWDLVNKVFYGNERIGEFVAGNIVA
jgi:hypothetical protein